ncbi:hypothetical protein D3C81_2246600 [compost metagenome]
MGKHLRKLLLYIMYEAFLGLLLLQLCNNFFKCFRDHILIAWLQQIMLDTELHSCPGIIEFTKAG